MRSQNPWLSIGASLFKLQLEAGEVIALRSFTILTAGDAGLAEARLMVTEKVVAAIELQQRALTGELGLDVLSAAPHAINHVRRKVRANRRRLRRR